MCVWMWREVVGCLVVMMIVCVVVMVVVGVCRGSGAGYFMR
jgi:hypothetical protein